MSLERTSPVSAAARRARDDTSHAQKAFLRAHKNRKTLIKITQWAILAAFLILWELAARLGWIDAFLLSSPSRICRAAVQLAREGQLWKHIGVTLAETLLGFGIGMGIGFILAVLMWWSPFWRRVLDPYLVIINALPKIALGPVLIVWMGIGMPAIIAIPMM